MKIYKILLIALLLNNTSLLAQKYPTINIGEQMPMQKIEIFDTNEKSRTLNNSLKNNGLLVVFTSNSCPFVVMWEDRYKLLEEKCRDSEIGMVYINSNQAKRNGDDSVEKMKNHSKEMGYTFPYLIDKNSEIANAFGAKTTPHIFLFNKGKKLVYKGAIDDNYKSANEVTENYLLDALENAGNQLAISIKETKAVGCSIKRVRK
jgi:thioredoxin-related protein|tara:strand:- start:518 stop:1129 length:612 start_codon:yes stop_codon:yes gene_type:complete